MSNEAQLRLSLRVKRGISWYQSQPTSFNADVTGLGGPAPGSFTASLNSTDVDLSKLTQPGLCWIANNGRADGGDGTGCYVTVGIWEPDTNKFYPLMEILPGEFFPIRLSRNLAGEFLGTGTSVGDTNNTLRIKSAISPQLVVVHAFDR